MKEETLMPDRKIEEMITGLDVSANYKYLCFYHKLLYSWKTLGGLTLLTARKS